MELINNYKPLFVKPPPNRYFVLTGGRGSAKSFHVSVMLLNLTYETGHVILFTRWTLTSAQISIIPEFIQKIEMLNLYDDFKITSDEVINIKTGSKILFKGIKTSQGTATANLKSISGVTTWVLDEAEELVDQDIFDKIDLSIRSRTKPNRVILIMNPSYKTHFIYNRWVKVKRNDTTYIHTSYLDNINNLSQSFIENANRLKGLNELRYRHLFLGEWLDEDQGILWNQKIIELTRIDTLPDLKRIVVAIDPSTTSTKNSDETGIIVGGIDYNNRGYVIEDLSGTYSPNEWGLTVAKAVGRHEADCIVAEKNQGGDMVENVIRQHDKKTRVKLVTATKGKYTRAEPIFGLYEQGKINHYGKFPLLESQMISFNPDKNTQSPDRVDALVWLFTDLMLNFVPSSNVTFSTPLRHKRRR